MELRGWVLAITGFISLAQIGLISKESASLMVISLNNNVKSKQLAPYHVNIVIKVNVI